MKIIDCRQGDYSWLAARLGRPTASEFDSLVTPLWKVREGSGVETYLYHKLAEHLTQTPQDDASAWAMEQGSILETQAIPWYEFTFDVPIKRVGFCTTDDGKIGCSPDGLIGEDGGIELKCPQPPAHLKYLTEGILPPKYAAQVHGSMLVTGRPWWIFMSYSRQFPKFILKVNRDEKIQSALRSAIDGFLERFDIALKIIDSVRSAANVKTS